MSGFNSLSNSLNNSRGQSPISSTGSQSNKIIYTAKVMDNSDYANMNRITAEIIDFDKNTGEETSGKDRNDNTPKVAFPLIPQFFNSIPQIGELVYIILENPKDQSSRRFYIGPIRSSNYSKTEFESTSSSNELFNISNYNGQNTLNPTNYNSDQNKNLIYIKGKNDSDIIFKSREVVMRAGSLKDGTFDKNTDTACYVQLIQKNEDKGFQSSFSQVNIVGSNINLISSDSNYRRIRALDEKGKLIDKSNVENTTNPRLEDYGLEAKQLHPLVLGDELVKVLQTIIRFCLNHAHTPQVSAYTPKSDIDILSKYLDSQGIEFILSKSIRTS